MMGFGVTTCEAKSSYGLDFETEVKMLEVLKKLNEDHPMDVVSTFMGSPRNSGRIQRNRRQGRSVYRYALRRTSAVCEGARFGEIRRYIY